MLNSLQCIYRTLALRPLLLEQYFRSNKMQLQLILFMPIWFN